MAIKPTDPNNNPKKTATASSKAAAEPVKKTSRTKKASSASGAIPYSRDTRTFVANPQQRYAAKIQDQDRTSPKLRLIQAKKEILKNIEKDFENPQSKPENTRYKTKTPIVNSAFIHGPSGSFTSDIFLYRALTNLEKEKDNIATQEGASNIVIIGRRKSSCERMARRLIRLADPKIRSDLETRIEVLDSYKIDKDIQKETEAPRIIFIPSESLNNVLSKKTAKETTGSDNSRDEDKVKRDLTDLTKYIGLKRLKYLYFDHAHTMTSRGRSLIFDYLKKNMDARVGTGFQEIIGTSYCNKFHIDPNDDEDKDEHAHIRDIRDKLDRHYSLPSPAELYRVALPDMYPAEIKDTSIGLELPEEEQIPGHRKNYTYENNFAYNQDWIKEHLIEGKREAENRGTKGLEVLYKEIQEDGIENPRVMISTQRIKTAQIIRDLLLSKGYKVGITNRQDGNKYFTSQEEEFSTDNRTELLDKFGKDFNILIHCGTLDGEEIPADLTMVYKIPSSSESLEKYTSSYRTPFPEEEGNPELLSERPRRLWLLDRPVKEKEEDDYEDLSLCRSLLGHIEARHKKGADGVGSASANRNRDHGLAAIDLDDLSPDQILKLRSPGITDHNPYVISGLNFGGNPKWLEYLDTKILQNYEGRNLDQKIRKLSEELAHSEDLANITEKEIEHVLRGLPSGLELEEQRDVLLYCFFEAGSEIEPKDITLEFPYVTGIASPEEVHTCINHALSLEKQITVINPWENFLNETYNGEGKLNAIIAKFLFENLDYDQRRILYDPEQLANIVQIIKTSQKANPDDTEAIVLKNAFEKYLLANIDTAKQFSALAAHEIRKEDYPLPESVSIVSAEADYNYLKKEGLLKASQEWLDALDSAIGLNPQQRKAITIEFLIRQHREAFSSKEKLTHSINLLQAGVKAESEEDKDLIKSFIDHINHFNNRLSLLVLNTHFPEIFSLNTAQLDEESNLNIIKTLLSSITTKNTTWNKVLLDCKNSNESPQIFLAKTYNEFLRTKISPATKEPIFSSQAKLKNALEALHNARRNTGTDAILLERFYHFMKTRYPKKFNLLKAQKELGKLISINTEARGSLFQAARITNFALAGSIAKSMWNQILEPFTEGKTTTSPQSKLAVKIPKFLKETGREKEFKKIEELSSILLGQHSSDKKTLAYRRGFFREFTFWFEKDLGTRFDRKLLLESFPEYFDYTDTITTEEDLSLRIQEILNTDDHSVRKDWLKLVEASVAKHNSKNKEDQVDLARYLARFILNSPNLKIGSEADLIANIEVLLACEIPDKKRHLVDPSNFAAKLRQDNPELRVATINSFFPGTLTGMIEDIDFHKPESIELNLREIFLRELYPHRNSTWSKQLQAYLKTEDLIPTIAKFLSTRTDTKFNSDAEFTNTVLTLLGDRRILDKRNPTTRTLLIDFLDYIYNDNANISIKFLAHTLFHDTLPMSTDEVKEAINNHIAVYIEDNNGKVQAASARAIKNQKDGVEEERIEETHTHLSDHLVNKIEKDYGISRINLFALTGTPLLQDSGIWTDAIADSIERGFYVSPNTEKRKFRVVDELAPGILDRLGAKLDPNSNDQDQQKIYSIPSLNERDEKEKKMFKSGIVEDIVKTTALTEGTNLLNIRMFLKNVFPEIKEYQDPTIAETPTANHRIIDPETKEAVRTVKNKLRFSTKGLYSFVYDSGDLNPHWRILFYPLTFEGTKFKLSSKASPGISLEEEIELRMWLKE